MDEQVYIDLKMMRTIIDQSPDLKIQDDNVLEQTIYYLWINPHKGR